MCGAIKWKITANCWNLCVAIAMKSNLWTKSQMYVECKTSFKFKLFVVAVVPMSTRWSNMWPRMQQKMVNTSVTIAGTRRNGSKRTPNTYGPIGISFPTTAKRVANVSKRKNYIKWVDQQVATFPHTCWRFNVFWRIYFQAHIRSHHRNAETDDRN